MLQICLPIVFLAGLLSTRLARSVVGTLVVDLQTPVPPGDLRGLLALTLADLSVDIVYPLDGTDRWIGSDSAPASLPVPGTGHAARSRCAATTRPGYWRASSPSTWRLRGTGRRTRRSTAISGWPRASLSARPASAWAGRTAG